MRVLQEWERVYKLTEQDGTTYYGTCQWGPGVTNPHGVKSGGGALCSNGFYHGYATKEVAAFVNPAHANIQNPRFWKAEIRGTVLEDGAMKLGATEMRTVREIPAIVPTTNQRVAFAIYVAGTVLEGRAPAWDSWADGWLSGRDRSAASAAACAACAAAYAAYNAAVNAAANAANAAYADADLLQDAAVFALQFDD